MDDSPLEPITSRKIYRMGFPGLKEPVFSEYVRPDWRFNDGYGLFDINLILRMVINQDGVPTQICFLRAFSNNPKHKEHALRAVKQWRFKPATLNGEPVNYYYTSFIQASLQQL